MNNTIQAFELQAITATPATNLIDISILPEQLRNHVLSYHKRQEKINLFNRVHNAIKRKSHTPHRWKILRRPSGEAHIIHPSYYHEGNIFNYLSRPWNCYLREEPYDKPRQYYLQALLKNIYDKPESDVEWRGRNATNFRMFIRMIHSLEAHTHLTYATKNLVYDTYDGFETHQKKISSASYARLNRLDGATAQIVLLIQ